MRIAVVAAGGIGGYFGGLLARAGEDVGFIARGAHLEAIRRNGLTVQSVNGDFTVRAPAAADPAELRPADLVLFAVKAYDTEVATASLPPLLGADTPVLTLQNGIEHVEQIGKRIGPERVLAGSVHLAVRIASPGVIQHAAGAGKIVLGEPEGPPTDRVRRVAAAFQRAGIPHQISGDMRWVLWDKLLFIAGVGGVTALARSGIGPLLAFTEGMELLQASLGEVVMVARAQGVDLGPDATERTLKFASTFPADWRSSLARDLEAGRSLEVEALNGAVVRLGRASGVPTPVNQAILACLTLPTPGP
jgi:2-dehydropantoate 2-reductase